jgi:hypothetical protein
MLLSQQQGKLFTKGEADVPSEKRWVKRFYCPDKMRPKFWRRWKKRDAKILEKNLERLGSLASGAFNKSYPLAMLSDSPSNRISQKHIIQPNIWQLHWVIIWMTSNRWPLYEECFDEVTLDQISTNHLL